MRKLWQFLDNYLLKIGVSFTLLFTALYPKLPSIHIVRTWVYIRLEDFLIASVVAIWLILVLRKKVKIPNIGLPIGLYWIVGLISLIYSLIFIGPHVVNFFPHIAILEYARRIEYMILFFVAFSTIKNVKDVRDYIIVLCITLTGVILYGLGQRYYLDFWGWFPQFFTKFPFCFPSFQTGNEEFAKGIPLCLPKEARITSTFGGHYDLAAYLVVVLPILVSVFIIVKKIWVKIGLGLLYIGSLSLLILTASRISFFAYLIGVSVALIFMKQKKWLIPVLAISILFLLSFSGSTAKRLFETFRIVNVVTNSQGQVVGVAENSLPDALKKKISKDSSVVVEAPPPTENLPTGSSFITLPQVPVATSVAVVKNQIPSYESLKLKLANGGLEISTISGTFLIKKALVYDISFTTRFQAEWPNAWAAFMSNPPLGKGYSSITLASDNDYLRLLGETGFLGLISFLLIFTVFGIFVKYSVKDVDVFSKATVLGIVGGVVGLFVNASLIDVFEASKVAEPLWFLLGIGAGVLALQKTENIPYIRNLKRIVTSHIFLVGYLFILLLIVFGGGLTNFFVGDDFTWLHWAAKTTPSGLLKNFIDAQGFFYRPLDKTFVFFLYNFFAFRPEWYHLTTLALHFVTALGVYLLGLFIFKNKFWAWVVAVLFMILPIHAETIFWFSTISISLSSLFVVYALLLFFQFRKGGKVLWYIGSLFLVLLALLSYEMAVVAPLLILISDIFIWRQKQSIKKLLIYLPYVILDGLYLILRSHAHVAPLSGDYAYNLSKLIPNTIGNIIGYIGLFFTGGNTFVWYEMLRSNLRPFAFLVGLISIVVVGGFILFSLRSKKATLFFQEKTLWYAVAFTVISLLPFLGLGNITERYGYLAGVGVAIGLGEVLRMSLARIKDIRKIEVVVLILVAIFSLWSMLSISSELHQWKKAGEVTEDTLAVFRFQYPGLNPETRLYFVNVPIKYGNAWIFPVGLSDGLWFVYTDNSPKIYEVKSMKDAEDIATKAQSASVEHIHQYFFSFDKNGFLTEEKDSL